MHPVITQVTQDIYTRSESLRTSYLSRVANAKIQGKTRSDLSCGNLAHTVAACPTDQKNRILDFTTSNLAIVTAYNDMLSAHYPYRHYPDQIKQHLKQLGHSAQVAGGVPAMCDGITQGQAGMELSLFSRDLIAQATALSLSHNTFDGNLLLGICDKIAPGMLIGALSFGHLPCAFVPAGPMGTGISNDEKAATRQKYVAGELDHSALQDMECKAYHSPGTCTFYGTANTNQLVFEAMGLMLPGSAFIPPQSALRDALTDEIAHHVATISASMNHNRHIANVVDEKSLVNGIVALLASGGSTNHTIHMVAIAKAAGFILTWEDIERLSVVVPLLTKMYPNGSADINQFQNAGAVPVLLSELDKRNLIHMDATPIYGSMKDYLKTPLLNDQGKLVYQNAGESLDPAVIAKPNCQFSEMGGIRVVDGNLGKGVVKVSAVAQENQKMIAPAKVFNHQDEVEAAYQQGLLNLDCIVIVRFNGPSANGMPELHKLMPILGQLMKEGHHVALVTDGRLSGASGKVPAIIHVSPEANRGGPLAFVNDDDLIEIDIPNNSFKTLSHLATERQIDYPSSAVQFGVGRELFSLFREKVTSADQGATIF